MTSETAFVTQFRDPGRITWTDWAEVSTLAEARDIEKNIRLRDPEWDGEVRILKIKRTITETELPPPAET